MAAGEVGGLTTMASGRPRSATLVAHTDAGSYGPAFSAAMVDW